MHQRQRQPGEGWGRQGCSRLPHPPSTLPRGEALRLHVGRLWLEVRALRRTDPPLPEAHWTAPFPLPALPARFFTLGSPGPAHEASSLRPTPTCGPFLGVGDGTRADPRRVVFPQMDPLLDLRDPTDPPKDQGLAHRQTWGSLQPKVPHVLSRRSYTETSNGPTDTARQRQIFK